MDKLLLDLLSQLESTDNLSELAHIQPLVDRFSRTFYKKLVDKTTELSKLANQSFEDDEITVHKSEPVKQVVSDNKNSVLSSSTVTTTTATTATTTTTATATTSEQLSTTNPVPKVKPQQTVASKPTSETSKSLPNTSKPVQDTSKLAPDKLKAFPDTPRQVDDFEITSPIPQRFSFYSAVDRDTTNSLPIVNTIIANPNFPKFNSKTTLDAMEFLEEFKDVCFSANIDPSRYISYLYNCVDHSTARWVRLYVKERPQTSWGQFCADFSKHYSSTNLPEMWKRQLKALVATNSPTSVIVYSDQFIDLADKIGYDFEDKHLLKMYIKGLPVSVRHAVIAVAEAKQIHELRGLIDQTLELANDYIDAAPARVPNCTYCRMDNHTNEQCYFQKQGVASKNTVSTNSNNNNNRNTTGYKPKSKPNVGQRDKSTVTCTKCKQLGHYANECTTPKETPGGQPRKNQM
jgi:hypothetical protein